MPRFQPFDLDSYGERCSKCKTKQKKTIEKCGHHNHHCHRSSSYESFTEPKQIDQSIKQSINQSIDINISILIQVQTDRNI
ncbi:hypothetical protein DERF_001979 [Dermatophagoides farinae]|uniref:Uncharacterized protein n=1 Tax=Dermatophagoides farinae TaxID=6954 RepID=A0A922IAM9_DERFA|nr:hypothetical protein DERF_001979 [Dermatophagoides farinae]